MVSFFQWLIEGRWAWITLPKTADSDEVRKIARVRTLTVLSQLDGERKGTLLQFLHESALINGEQPIISLDKADLRKADLSNASLNEANLEGASLQDANLKGAFLWKVNLSKANLRDADLRNAFLGEATLIGADLSQANLREVNLSNAVLNWTRQGLGLGLEGLTEIGQTMMNPNASEAELRQALQHGIDLGNLIPRESDMDETALRLALLGEAILTEVDLSGANLKNAVITPQQLEKAKWLQGATMPDGSKHP